MKTKTMEILDADGHLVATLSGLTPSEFDYYNRTIDSFYDFPVTTREVEGE